MGAATDHCCFHMNLLNLIERKKSVSIYRYVLGSVSESEGNTRYISLDQSNKEVRQFRERETTFRTTLFVVHICLYRINIAYVLLTLFNSHPLINIYIVTELTWIYKRYVGLVDVYILYSLPIYRHANF